MEINAINFIIGFIGSIFGGGVIYGAIKERLHTLETNQTKDNQLHDKIDQKFTRVVFKDSHESCIAGTKALLASIDGKLDMLLGAKVNYKKEA